MHMDHFRRRRWTALWKINFKTMDASIVLSSRTVQPEWPDWTIYWTLGIFSRPLAAISLPKSSTFLGNFCKGVKIFNFLVKFSLGNFYRHLATFYWSHCAAHRVGHSCSSSSYTKGTIYCDIEQIFQTNHTMLG